MSWSEQEKNLKSKLLNYTEDVNNDELWNVISQRTKSERKSSVFPIVTISIICLLLSMLMSAYLINEKNNSIFKLNKKIKEQETIIKDCAENNSLISKKQNTLLNTIDLLKTNSEVESKLKNKNNSVKDHKTTSLSSNKIIAMNKIEKLKDETIIKEATLETEKLNNVSEVAYPSNLLPLDILKQELIFKQDQSGFKSSFTKPLLQKQYSYFISIHGGSPFTNELNLSSENKKAYTFSPVLANRFSLGINKNINNKINIRGEMMYELLVSKHLYNSTKIDQINLNDTSLITIDPIGNYLVDIDNVIGTKITTKKGEVYNVSNTFGVNVSLAYSIKTKLRGRVGIGYNLWQHNRGINKETSIKFDTNDKMFGYKTNYMIGLDYKLSKCLYLDILFNYSKSNYALNNAIYQRKYYTPMIGIAYWMR